MRKIAFTTPFKNSHGGANVRQNATKSFLTNRLRKLPCLAALLIITGWSQQAFSQCALVCNDNVNVSLPGPDANCELTITVDMVLESYSCVSPVTVTLLTTQGVPLASPVVNATHIGKTLIFSVKETSTGNSCWGTMKVEDKLGPLVTNCVNDTLTCLDNYLPTTEGGDAAAPIFADCSTIINTSYADVISHGTCTTPFFVAVITRTWTATDIGGYSSNCTQTIYIERVSLATYTPVCPANYVVECGSGVANTSPTVTGYPTITVGGTAYNIIPGANNFCEIAASYADEVFNICGGGKKILRTWTIYDWCLPTGSMGNPFSCIQVIKLQDTTPPVVTCPAPIVKGTASNGCFASLTLPPATVTDACSNWTVKVLTPFGTINGNGGFMPNVPVGVHQVTYVATDACGNINSCIVSLTVIDNTQPVAVCDQHTTVSLTADGTAIVAADVFDNGSSDNCAIDYFRVRRMVANCQPDTNFDSTIVFRCCDIGQIITVSMRVYDKAGNYNDCMVQVDVQDKIDPTIVCPPDVSVECGNLVPDSFVPTINDNCSGAQWVYQDSPSLSLCGLGTIFRLYTVTDAGGRTAACTQKIYVVDSDPFGLSDITWPLDYETFQCDASMEPDDLPPGQDRPALDEDPCDLIAVSFTDQYLPTSPPACLKILRKWIVIDWCLYNPNNPGAGGYWEHVQVLKITDNTPPVITCPSNTVVTSFSANCGFEAVTLAAATATDCSTTFKWTTTLDFHSDNSIDVAGTNPNLSGSYQFGIHTAVIKVEDFCGNTSSCTFTIEVKDIKKPTPVCVNGLAVELMPDPGGNGGMLQLTPNLFNQGSYDNCTTGPELLLEIIPSQFDCSHVGTNIVTLYVTDEAGNTDFCETYVIIQDNMVVCPAIQTANVAGAVSTASGSGMPGVVVNVSGNGPLTAPVVTTQNGNFQFFEMDLGHDYTFTPGYNQQPLNGVTTYDLVLMTRNILNIEVFNSPYKFIAADINKSGTVTTADIVELRRLILQAIPSFSNNNSWRFVDRAYVFANPQNPFQPPFPELFNVNNLTGDRANVDFVAVKIGDVNGSAVTNFTDPATDRNTNGRLTFVVEDQPVKTGELIRIPFRANDFVNITGYQFALHFDPGALRLQNIDPGELANLTEANFGLTKLEEGIITTSWDNTKNTLHNNNTVLFTLEFQASANGRIRDLLQMAPATMLAEAYQNDDSQQMQVLGVQLAFNKPEPATAAFELYQNIPNPFLKETSIGFSLPEAGTATLTVYDLAGKTLKTVTDNFAKGYNEITLDAKDLGTAGVLLYKLETPQHTATQRMVRL